VGLALLSLIIPKNACPEMYIGPITGLQSLIIWIFILLKLICGIISIYAFIKISRLERGIKKEIR